MTYGAPALSDHELRYPFTPNSRKFFEAIPVEEGIASQEVLRQVESRLLNALGRGEYETHLSELVEFSSFFVAALVASQDGFLTSKFAKKESERAKEFFMKEDGRSKAVVMAECFGLSVTVAGGDDRQRSYSAGFEDYLMVTSKYELTKAARWKLSRQSLELGVVRIGDNLLNDLFADCSQKAVAEGAKNLRRAAFPKQLAPMRDGLLRFVPAPRVKTGRGYNYVEELLKQPVSDGRHRLVWMVLAPYLVNVKKLEDEAAVEKIRGFVSVAGETADMKRFVMYNVRRARRNGLMPPTFSTLKAEHPDLYALLPSAVLAAEMKGPSPEAKAKPRREA